MYLLINEWYLGDGETYDSEYELFDNYEKAKERFLEKVNDAKVDADEWQLDDEEEDEDLYQTWLSGEYGTNHITVELRKIEVK